MRFDLSLKVRNSHFMSDWMPSLNALRAFESVGRLLSYRAAAHELNVTPGAVKHLVAKLEATLGSQLVQRKGHGLELTPLGRAGMAEMSLGMRHFSDGVRKITLFPDLGPGGTV